MSEENLIEVGRVTHFFTKINVAVIELNASLAVGDTIVIKGPTTDFEQVVESMQIEHENWLKEQEEKLRQNFDNIHFLQKWESRLLTAIPKN